MSSVDHLQLLLGSKYKIQRGPLMQFIRQAYIFPSLCPGPLWDQKVAAVMRREQGKAPGGGRVCLGTCPSGAEGRSQGPKSSAHALWFPETSLKKCRFEDKVTKTLGTATLEH